MADDKNKESPEETKARLKREEFTKKNQKALTEQNKINKEQNEILGEIKAQLQSTSQQSVKDLKELLDSQTNKLGKDRFSDEERKNLTDQFGLEQLGFDDASARISARNQVEILNKEKERLEELQKEFGIGDDTEIQALQSDIESLEEIKKFGRTLTGFEKKFQFFAGETMDELIASTKNGGALTAEGITKGLGADLKNDFDKVLGFLGPAVGFLQQIPLLGTILNLAKAFGKKLFTQLFLTRKANKLNSKKEILAQEKSSHLLRTDIALEQKERRREARERLKQRFKKGSGDTTINEGDTTTEDGGFGISGALIPLAAAVRGLPETTGRRLSGLAAGLGVLGSTPGVMLGAAKLAGIVVLLGGAVALAIAATIAGVAGGFLAMEKAKTAKTFKDLSDPAINYAKIAGGLALIGSSSVLSAAGGLIQTITTLGGVFTPFSDLGKDLGTFAKEVKPFMELDAKQLGVNMSALMMSIEKSPGFFKSIGMAITDNKFEKFGNDLSMFATKIKPFIDLNMSMFQTNLKMLADAFNNFEIEKLSFNEKQALRDIERLGSLKFRTDDYGKQFIQLGTGINLITSGIETLTLEKVNALGQLGRELNNQFDNLTMNFGTVTQAAGAGINMNQPQSSVVPPTNIVVADNSNVNNTTVRKSYSAAPPPISTLNDAIAIGLGSIG